MNVFVTQRRFYAFENKCYLLLKVPNVMLCKALLLNAVFKH